uniref:Uncharacterized protein n=1 Tax=Babesia bovis TaxID=5865 RepID=A7APT8_BABBO|eukprot:XP_001612140.1 hypothetical protein [Babesia bovis T2Bo]
MTADDIGLMLNAFTRQKHNCEEILHYVDAHAKRLLSECSFRTTALVANAFAKSERHSRVLIETISNRLKQEVEKYTLNKRNTTGSIDVIGTALTEGQSGSELESNVQIQAISTSRQEKQFNIIDVAMIFNAFAKMEEHPLELLNAYIPWLMDHIQSETPTLSLVLLCHAYSRSGVVNKDLYIKMAHVLIQRVNALNCQQLGIVALAYAKTKQSIPILFFRIADEVIYRGTVALKFKRYHFDFQSLEQLSQAFTRVGFQDQRVYIVLTTLLKRRLKTAGTDEIDGDLIASTLTSMAPHHVEAFKTFITDAIMRTKDTTAYSTGAICRVLSAFGKLKIAHKSITEAMLNQAKDRVNEFQIPVLINTLKALAKLNKYNLNLIKESLKRCSMHLVHLSTIDIANLLSALSGKSAQTNKRYFAQTLGIATYLSYRN